MGQHACRRCDKLCCAAVKCGQSRNGVTFVQARSQTILEQGNSWGVDKKLGVQLLTLLCILKWS